VVHNVKSRHHRGALLGTDRLSDKKALEVERIQPNPFKCSGSGCFPAANTGTLQDHNIKKLPPSRSLPECAEPNCHQESPLYFPRSLIAKQKIFSVPLGHGPSCSRTSQSVSYLRYIGRIAKAFGKIALDPGDRAPPGCNMPEEFAQKSS
jgi:hypothetical protein